LQKKKKKRGKKEGGKFDIVISLRAKCINYFFGRFLGLWCFAKGPNGLYTDSTSRFWLTKSSSQDTPSFSVGGPRGVSNVLKVRSPDGKADSLFLDTAPPPSEPETTAQTNEHDSPQSIEPALGFSLRRRKESPERAQVLPRTIFEPLRSDGQVKEYYYKGPDDRFHLYYLNGNAVIGITSSTYTAVISFMWTNAIYQVVPYIEALIHAFIYRDPDKMQNLVEADYVTFAISPEPDGEWMRAVDRMLRERLLSLVPLWRILSSQAQKFPYYGYDRGNPRRFLPQDLVFRIVELGRLPVIEFCTSRGDLIHSKSLSPGAHRPRPSWYRPDPRPPNVNPRPRPRPPSPIPTRELFSYSLPEDMNFEQENSSLYLNPSTGAIVVGITSSIYIAAVSFLAGCSRVSRRRAMERLRDIFEEMTYTAGVDGDYMAFIIHDFRHPDLDSDGILDE